MKLKLFIIALLTILLFSGYALASRLDSSLTSKPTSGDSLKNGLVGWWTMDGADVNATQVLDKSGLDQTGTRSNVTPVPGKIGQAMSFNGKSSKIAITKTAIVYPISISFWYKIPSSVTGAKYLMGLNGDTYPIIVWSGNLVYFGGSGGAQINSGIASRVYNTWHLYTVVAPSTSIDLADVYIDGVLSEVIAANSAPSNQPGTVFTLGSLSTITLPLLGSMDDVRVYNRALSASEVTALYKYGQTKIASSLQAKPTSGDALKNSLVGWWTMDGQDINATQVLDKSGLSNTGTRVSTTAFASGKIGQAFSSKNGYISALDAIIDTSQPFTFSAWGFAKTLNSGLSLGGDYNNNGFMLLSTTLNRLCGYDTDVFACTVIKLNAWNHYFFTYDGIDTSNFYINNVLKGSSAITLADGGNLQIGTYKGRLLSQWDGKIDDVRIYNKVLSASEMLSVYNFGQTKLASSLQNEPASGNSLKSGLVGWWTMDGQDVTSTGILDKSGLNNNGGRTTVTPVAGKIGQGMKFDGKSSNVSIADKSYFSPPNNSMTIAGWFKTTMTTRGTVVGKGVAGQYEWAVEVNGSFANKLTFQTWQSGGTGYGDASSVSVVLDGKWHYFVATINYGVSQQLYIDGKLEGSDTTFDGSMTDNTSVVEIGRRPDAVNYFNGSIDDVRVYNRALSAAEIQQLYSNGK